MRRIFAWPRIRQPRDLLPHHLNQRLVLEVVEQVLPKPHWWPRSSHCLLGAWKSPSDFCACQSPGPLCRGFVTQLPVREGCDSPTSQSLLVPRKTFLSA